MALVSGRSGDGELSFDKLLYRDTGRFELLGNKVGFGESREGVRFNKNDPVLRGEYVGSGVIDRSEPADAVQPADAKTNERLSLCGVRCRYTTESRDNIIEGKERSEEELSVPENLSPNSQGQSK